MKYFIVKLAPDTPRTIRNKLSKTLRGTTVTLKGRRYRGRGLVEKYNGLPLCPGTYLIPAEHVEEFLDDLGSRGLRNYVSTEEICICKCS